MREHAGMCHSERVLPTFDDGGDEAYYSEPERGKHTNSRFADSATAGLEDIPNCGPQATTSVAVAGVVAAPPAATHRGRAASRSPVSRVHRDQSPPTPVWARSSVTKAEGTHSSSTSRFLGEFPKKWGWAERFPSPERRQCCDLGFLSWISDEVRSRPDETQLSKIPRSHLLEVAQVPARLEKLLIVGFLLCLDLLLHELTFTPLQVCFAMPRLFNHALRTLCRKRKSTPVLSVTEAGDFVRVTLLLFNVLLVHRCFDVSGVYHYIRGESFLKLYVIFNMLEMFERWCRSVGVDLFDLLMASVRQSWFDFLPKYLVTLAYCFVHANMHFLRVLLLQVAINTSSSAVFLIIVTNNFGEIKSTVFKRYDQKGLFPIVTSDMVERFYLLADIIFVVARLSIPTHRGTVSAFDIINLLFLLVLLELSTDWIKFALIFKFSDLKADTLDTYKEVLLADTLVCRVVHLSSESGNSSSDGKLPPLSTPFRGIHSFSHSLQRRLGFSGVPMTTMVVVHFLILARSPCHALLQHPRLTSVCFGATLFSIVVLAKILLSLIILGFSARRRGRIPRGFELFSKIKAL